MTEAWLREVIAAGMGADVAAEMLERFLDDEGECLRLVDLAYDLEREARRVADAVAPASASGAGWLRSAADLLSGPDPGPTPFAIDGLLVEGTIAAVQGPPKAGKTWLVLELAIALVDGCPALGRFDVPEPGPVMLIVEESGEEALRRRLGMLTRGRALPADAVGELYCAANLRVRLNERDWQRRLIAAGRELRPRAIILDPLARLKGASVDENVQREIGPVLDFMRALRDETSAAVVFVHHTGHEGGRLRGSSDLEGYWESKIAVSRADGVCALVAEHREAEATPEVSYRLGFDAATNSVRLSTIERDEPPAVPVGDRIAEWLAGHAGATTEEIRAAVMARRDEVRTALESDARFRRVAHRPGTNARAKCWALVDQSAQGNGADWGGLSEAPPSPSSPGAPSAPLKGAGARGGLREGARPEDAGELAWLAAARIDEIRERYAEEEPS